MKNVRYRGEGIVAVAISVIAIGWSNIASTDETVTFNDPRSLAALVGSSPGERAARFSFVYTGRPPKYVEDCAVFTEGVDPPDPALGPIPQGHYHLMYEDPAIHASLFIQQQLRDPENQGRYLMPMCPGATIQMTYEPDGVPRPFTLKSLQVLKGSLNVGIKSNNFGIGVYNNLTGGVTYSLGDADNITRATFELPRDARECGGFAIDNIVFEPFTGSPRCASNAVQEAQVSQAQVTQASPPFADAATVTFTNAEFAPDPIINIRPFRSINDINPESPNEIRVAIISRKGFDATIVDPTSVEFGPSKAREVHHQSHLSDVDGDGDTDVLLHFKISEIGVVCSDIALSLAGQTFDGQRIAASDFVATQCEDNSVIE